MPTGSADNQQSAPPSSPGASRKPMSPSERARHASLVRWGKEQPFAARLEAVRERRKAAKQKKATGKGKASKPAKPTPQEKEAQAEQERQQNIAAVGDALNQADNETLSKNGLTALVGAAEGQEPPKAMAEGLIAGGLAVRGEDGRFRLTADGSAVVRAAESGNANAVLDRLSAVNDKNVAKREKEEKAPKGGGGGGGSSKPTEEEKEKEKEEKRTENRAKVGAQLEENGIDISASELDTLSALASGDDVDEALVDGLAEMGLVEVDSEGNFRATTQGRSAVRAAERGDYGATIDAVSRAKERKAKQKEREQAKRERQAERRQREDERRAKEDERRAQEDGDEPPRKRTGNQGPMRPGLYSKTEDIAMDYTAVLGDLEALRDEMLDLASDDDSAIKAGRRNSSTDQGLLDQGYALAEQLCELFEALGAETGEEEDAPPMMGGEVEMMEGKAETVLIGGAVKMMGDDTVVGPAVWLNGTPETPDLSPMRDFFTKSTEFWLDEWERRPMLWHHNVDEPDILEEMREGGAGIDEIKAMQEALAYLEEHPVIGTWTKAAVDPVAVWVQGQTKKAHRYRGAIKQLIDRGLIRLSTDSAPHLVRRVRQSNGTHEVKRWPIVAVSLTTSAAEPRLLDVQSIKSLYDAAGITPPFAIYDNPEVDEPEEARPDAVKASDAERSRRLLLQAQRLRLQE